ncbi:MAG: hypothetical protein AMXMBFR84_42490 [Candidatus Hydrogenedentota bacterium]
MTLLSALFGAGAAALLAWIIRRFTDNAWAAFGGAAIFAFSAEHWEQSVIAEVYSLNTFLIALCLVILELWREYRTKRYLYLFAVVYGLGLANHHLMAFLGPFFGACILYMNRHQWKDPLVYETYLLMMLVAFGVAGLTYLYLPIRSAANPAVDWGNPETWQNFKDVITRQQYAFGYTENSRSISRFVGQVGVFFERAGQEFTWLLAWLPFLGLYSLWRKDRARAVTLLGLLLYVAFGTILTINFDLDKISIWLNSTFWIPSYFAAAAFAGAGLAWIAEQRVKGMSLKWAGNVLALIAPLIPLTIHYESTDKSDYTWSRDYALNTLASMEPNAIYFPTADHATFPILYLQAVDGLRPDVTLANKYGYPEEELYKGMPEMQRRSFRKIPTAQEEQVIEDWIIQNNPDRPVYFTRKRPVDGIPGARMVNAGLLYRVLRQGESLLDNESLWNSYTWTTLDPSDVRGDLTAGMILSDYHFARGRHHLERNDTESAVASFDLALSVGGDTKEALNNIGSACAESGLLKDAESYYARAVDLDPDYLLTRRNLGKVYVQTQQFAAALEQMEALLTEDPLDPEANWLAVDCLKGLGRTDDAIAQLQRMATFPYREAKVHREMGMIYLESKKDNLRAMQSFSQSLSIDSNQPGLSELMSRLAAQANQPQSQDPTIPNPMPLPSIPGIDAHLPQIPVPEIPSLPGLP